MAVYDSRINRQSKAFAANRADVLALVDRLWELAQRPIALSEERRARFEEWGQLTPRERIVCLLDPGMPFLEFYNMANYLADDPDLATSIPGVGLIAGIGFVGGVRCMLYVDDSGIAAGAIATETVAKSVSIPEMALRFNLPLFHLAESAGANLMNYRAPLRVNGGKMFHHRPLRAVAGRRRLLPRHERLRHRRSRRRGDRKGGARGEGGRKVARRLGNAC